MNRHSIINPSKNKKRTKRYAKLRRWIIPALLGFTLSAAAFVPTFAAEEAASSATASATIPGAMTPSPPDETGAPHPEISASAFTGTKILTVPTDISSEFIQNSTSDQNAVIAKSGVTGTIDNSALEKSGNTTSDDNSNFRGQNAAVLAIEGSTLNVTNSNIITDADGSNAIFATDNNSTINVTNTNIHTKQNSSRGLDATYNGTVNGKALTVTTEGAHSATVATDRGEGTVTVDTAKLTTSGAGSPVIYSTGNITVNNVNGEAQNSEIGVIEGKNSITLTDSNMIGHKDNGFMLYQSFSGDAESGVARLNADNNTLTTHGTGAFLYVNNTVAEADLSNNTIIMDNTDTVINAAGDSRWGESGKNGGHLTVNARRQDLAGNIRADAISSVNLNLNDGSTLVGAVNTANTGGAVNVTLSSDSTWTLTGDSYIKTLTNEDPNNTNINLNGYKLTVQDR